MTVEPQAQDQPSARAESEIRKIVEEGLAKWRTARQQANPHGHVTVADECEMRRRVTEFERARRGLPLDAIKQSSGAVEWDVRTYLDAQQSQITEPPWKVKGLVVEGGATQISAHPHGMKSLSSLNAAPEAVAVHTVWRHFDASTVERALYIESEDPEWLVAARIRGIAKGLGLEPDKPLPGFHYVCPGPFDFVKEEETLRGLFAKLKPDFVVLSTLQNVLAGRDWLSQKEMQDVNALIVRLSRVCPLVVLTHSPWNKEQRRAAGTITQFANFATTMHYEKTRTSDGRDAIHIVVDSKVGASINDFHLTLETEGDQNDPSTVRGLVYGGEGRPKGAAKEAVLEALANDPQASAEEIAERARVTSRYVRSIKAESAKNRRRRSKRGAGQAVACQIDPDDPRLTSQLQDDDITADAYADVRKRRRR